MSDGLNCELCGKRISWGSFKDTRAELERHKGNQECRMEQGHSNLRSIGWVQLDTTKLFPLIRKADVPYRQVTISLTWVGEGLHAHYKEDKGYFVPVWAGLIISGLRRPGRESAQLSPSQHRKALEELKRMRSDVRAQKTELMFSLMEDGKEWLKEITNFLRATEEL